MRAKRMIDKLNLMSRELVTVIRDGEKDAIPPEKLVLGDLMLLSSGEQIPSDAEVMSGIAEANEAMLTGESDLVLKELAMNCFLVVILPVVKSMPVSSELEQTTMPTN